MGSDPSEGITKTGGRRWKRTHPRPLAEHHGAGSSPSAGSLPAPFTKPEECIPPAFRGGVRGPRLPSRIPEGREPRDRGVGGVMTQRVECTAFRDSDRSRYSPLHPPSRCTYTHQAQPPPACSARARSVRVCSRLFSSARPWTRASCFWRWRCRRTRVIAFAVDRAPLSLGRASGGAVASRRAAPKQKRRRPCPCSGGDQHAAFDELGEEAEHVTLYRAVPYVPATRNPRRRRHGEVGGAQAGILHASDQSRQGRRSWEKTPRWCMHGPLHVAANNSPVDCDELLSESRDDQRGIDRSCPARCRRDPATPRRATRHVEQAQHSSGIRICRSSLTFARLRSNVDRGRHMYWTQPMSVAPDISEVPSCARSTT